MNLAQKIIPVVMVFAMANIGYAQNPLFIPPILNGPVYDLEMQNGTKTLLPGHTVPTMGFNGNFLGPTLVMQQGQQIKINVLNSLGEETTVHWHGLHVSPENDGGPHAIIGNNETWSPTFTMLNKAATFWYHPHMHKYTQKQVARGLAGMIIVKDPVEAALNIPRTYGIDDIPVILQTEDINLAADTIRYGLQANQDNTLLVNGTRDPIVDMPKQMVRLRVVNASAYRIYNLGLSDNSSFWQMASDAGLLAAPVLLSRILLSPGERVEIMVNLSSATLGQGLSLMNYGTELGMGMYGSAIPAKYGQVIPNYNGNTLNNANYPLVKFNVVPTTINPAPVTAGNMPYAYTTVAPPSNPVKTRFKYLGSGGSSGYFLTQAGLPEIYDLNINHDTVNLGDVEEWFLVGDSIQAHPFHLHDVHFTIYARIDSNNVTTFPTGGDIGYKDVVIVKPKEKVVIRMKFEDFTSDMPYVYHCHILPHEDFEMMQNFVVLDNIYVDKNYNGTQAGSFSQPYKKFEDAVAAAKNGSTIIFKSNGDHTYTYPPYITVADKRIRIKLSTGAVTIN